MAHLRSKAQLEHNAVQEEDRGKVEYLRVMGIAGKINNLRDLYPALQAAEMDPGIYLTKTLIESLDKAGRLPRFFTNDVVQKMKLLAQVRRDSSFLRAEKIRKGEPVDNLKDSKERLGKAIESAAKEVTANTA